jgi:hypothetical protein
VDLFKERVCSWVQFADKEVFNIAIVELIWRQRYIVNNQNGDILWVRAFIFVSRWDVPRLHDVMLLDD